MSDTPALSDPGHIINNKYKIIEKLGEGSYGIVVKAIDTRTDAMVAVKISNGSSSSRRAAKEELMALNYIALKDPANISLCVKLVSSFEYNGNICIAFEQLGSDIYHFMKENGFAPFPLNQVRQIAFQLCYAVNFLHHYGMIHTDLKLDNILFIDSSYTTVYNAEKKMYKLVDSTYIRLIDFGCAVDSESPRSGRISHRYYRAPEVILNANWSQPVDVWSIGCILYELYTGNILFKTAEDDLQHLGILEKVLGSIPHSMTADHEYFTNGKLNFDWSTKPRDFHQPLQKCLKSYSEDDIYLCDLMKKLLAYEPSERITLKEAIIHPFFKKLSNE